MKKLPDETGWYWTKDDNDEWAMAYVDVEREQVLVCVPQGNERRIIVDDFELHPACGIVAWYGPIRCPGGDFGGHTIICDEGLEQKAEHEGKVIGIQFFDFKHCSDEKSGVSFVVSWLYTREEVGERLRLEVE